MSPLTSWFSVAMGARSPAFASDRRGAFSCRAAAAHRLSGEPAQRGTCRHQGQHRSGPQPRRLPLCAGWDGDGRIALRFRPGRPVLRRPLRRQDEVAITERNAREALEKSPAGARKFQDDRPIIVPKVGDRDGDGILDDVDKCPTIRKTRTTSRTGRLPRS